MALALRGCGSSASDNPPVKTRFSDCIRLLPHDHPLYLFMLAPLLTASAILTLHAFLATQAYAEPVNITVDDTNSTLWGFPGGWHAVTPLTPCGPGCLNNPDPTQAFNSTWHDGNNFAGFFTFQASAVYIYGIDNRSTAGTKITFTMEDPHTLQVHEYPPGAIQPVYNVLFFSAINLDATIQRTVSFFGGGGEPGAGPMLLDYAVITVDSEPIILSSASATSAADPSASSSSDSTVVPVAKHTSNIGAIAGAVVGVVAALLILAGVLVFLRRRRRRRGMEAVPAKSNDVEGAAPVPGQVEPYYVSPPSARHSLEPRHSGGPSFMGGAVSSSGASTVTTQQQLSPTATSARSEKSGAAPVVLSWDRNSARAPETELEARVRQLEALTRPPEYN
ncbi:hypothetical protein C8R46DRAFT_1321726 [Mycena filopes]|nr:hypothetical protein C8R46DRAFT_1321726 [Mycena filopes]